MPTGPEDELDAVILAEARRIAVETEPRVNAEVDKLIAHTLQLETEHSPVELRGNLMADLDEYVQGVGAERALDLAVALVAALLLRLAGVKPLTPRGRAVSSLDERVRAGADALVRLRTQVPSLGELSPEDQDHWLDDARTVLTAAEQETAAKTPVSTDGEFVVGHPYNGGLREHFREERDALGHAAFLAQLAMTVPGQISGRPVFVLYPNGALVEFSARMIRKPPS